MIIMMIMMIMIIIIIIIITALNVRESRHEKVNSAGFGALGLEYFPVLPRHGRPSQ